MVLNIRCIIIIMCNAAQALIVVLEESMTSVLWLAITAGEPEEAACPAGGGP